MTEMKNENIGEGFRAAVASQVVPCPVCGSTSFVEESRSGDYEYELPGEFFVAKCKSCSLILQNPRPTFDEILRYYTEKYEPFKSVGSPVVLWIRDFVLGRPRRLLYERLIGKAGAIIDVGCATGLLLQVLSANKGWRLKGIEPVPEAAAEARRLGLDVDCATLEAAGVDDESFDLAIMNHVLEHLPDPGETVQNVYRVLKPGGWFVGEIPSPRCIERAVFGRYWGGYHLPRHLTFFTPELVGKFLRNYGFTDIQIEGQPQPSSWLLSCANWSRSGKGPRWLARFVSPHSFFWLVITTPFSFFLNTLGSSPIIRFVAKKPINRLP